MLHTRVLKAEKPCSGAEEEKEIEEELEEGVENNAALLNSKSHETKGRRVTTSLAGLLLALLAGIFGGELAGLAPSVQTLASVTYYPELGCPGRLQSLHAPARMHQKRSTSWWY